MLFRSLCLLLAFVFPALHAADERALADQAIALLQQGKTAEAIQLFEKALAANPQSADARFNLALAYLHNRQFDETIRVVSVSNRLRAEDYALLGAAHRAKGSFDTAAINMRRAVAMQPGNSDFAYDLALTLIDAGKSAEAVRLLESAAAKPEAPAKVFGALGMASFMNGNLPRAELAYAKAIKMEPGAADLHASLGDVWFGSGDFRKAAAEYTAATRLDPANPDYHNKAGRNLLRLDQTAAAEAEFRNALAADPHHADALFNLGKIAGVASKNAEAVTLLERAVQSDPNHTEALYQLSLAYQRQGDREKAAATMQRFRDLKKQK
ncbi:MAG: tetratricopeptide repeat protein [Bryobacteraceae bacterium]